MSLRTLVCVGITAIALVSSVSTIALARSSQDPTSADPSNKGIAAAHTSAAAQPAAGCKLWIVHADKLGDLETEQFLASRPPVALYQEPSLHGLPGAYWAVFQYRGAGAVNGETPPISTWMPSNTAAAHRACGPFLEIGKTRT